jgi:hypothetical protein
MISLAPVGASNVLHLRVELPEVWDVVRIDAISAEPVRAVKIHALQALAPGALFHDDYVVKLRGKEIIDENQSLAAAGAVDGATFLVTHRYRRPVR